MTIKKLAIAGLACLALCGTSMAAPKGGNSPRVGRTPEPKRVIQSAPKRTQRAAPPAARDKHSTPPRVVHNQPAAHRAPAPQPPRKPRHPASCRTHNRRDCTHSMEASLIGGVIGGLIAAFS